MRRLVALVAMVLLISVGSALADHIPLDPRAGVAGGGLSTPITTTTFTFVLQLCGLPGSPPECTTGPFTNPQAVFSGVNLTGIPWDQIMITLNLPNPLATAQAFTCSGGALFSITDCPAILPAGTTSVTFTLSKGTGTGIGCYTGTNPESDFQCLINSINALNPPSNQPFYQPDSESAPCAENPLQVCGPAHFVIGVGFDNDVWPEGSIPTGGTAVVPEPGTLALVLASLGPLIFAARRKRFNPRA